MNANAAVSAAMQIRSELIKAASEITGADEERIVIGDRRVFSKDDPSIGDFLS